MIKSNYLASFASFIYFWQLTGCIHILGHWIAARIFGINCRVIIPWQRFIPLYGWVWNLCQPHNKMMCEYQTEEIDAASPFVRVLIGFSGPYSQLCFIIFIGIIIIPEISEILGGKTLFALLMCVWQLIYFVWYAIYFHTDKFSDFTLFVGPTFEFEESCT